MEPDDPAAEFRLFLAAWLDTADWSQYQLASTAGIGQSIISRWLNPAPGRRTVPSPDTLRKIADVVGRPYDDLMRMAGFTDSAPGEGDDPPELAALLADIKAGWHALDAGTRQNASAITRVAFHVQRQRRPRRASQDHSVSDGRVDRPKEDYRTHSIRTSLSVTRSIAAVN